MPLSRTHSGWGKDAIDNEKKKKNVVSGSWLLNERAKTN